MLYTVKLQVDIKNEVMRFKITVIAKNKKEATEIAKNEIASNIGGKIKIEGVVKESNNIAVTRL